VSTYGLKLFTNSKKIIVLNVKVKALQNCFFSLLFGFASFRILRISGPERETNKKLVCCTHKSYQNLLAKRQKNTRVIITLSFPFPNNAASHFIFTHSVCTQICVSQDSILSNKVELSQATSVLIHTNRVS